MVARRNQSLHVLLCPRKEPPGLEFVAILATRAGSMNSVLGMCVIHHPMYKIESVTPCSAGVGR